MSISRLSKFASNFEKYLINNWSYESHALASLFESLRGNGPEELLTCYHFSHDAA